MGYIKQLSEDLIKKIAAGEVVERPASVVKELVENSIDAGATKIQIEIQRCGKYIKVSDNGMGIDPDDVDLLFSRHATSKIKSFDDLWNIASLGFRGEALASISSVSNVICRSKHINQDYGFELKVIDGKINKKTSAISIGTIFEIDDLFYNVPARQKFLKSESTELDYVYDVVISEAISHPKAAIALLNNKNILLKSSGSNNLTSTIVELLGQDLKDKLISLSAKNHFVELSGYVSSLEVYRADRKSFFVFINNRPIKCQIISKAVFSAFEGLLPPGKFPVVVLNFNFKPRFVDVNVHPTKKEVRYTHPNDVYNLVLHCIQSTVAEHYKNEYKEKSVYTLPDTKNIELSPVLLTPSPSYSEAAFDFYARVEEKETEKQSSKEAEIKKTTEQTLFSINNLQCRLICSEKPIASMTKVGNKTIFEVGLVFDENMQIVFNGEIIGEQNYQKNFFNSLSDLSKEIYKYFLSEEKLIQKKLVDESLENEECKDKSRKKPPLTTLYKIWERDKWTCVYCGKQLLDPEVVKKAMPKGSDAFVTYTNSKGEEITNHILREHIASYDHYLPVSKLPQFNFDIENLFACCIECNRKKLDSMDLNTWKPNKQNNWKQPLEIAGLIFTSSNVFKEALSTKGK